MILYLDTSALVKAYITEHMSNKVMDAIEKSDIIASHSIAYVEAHAAFARLKREQKINESTFVTIKKVFIEDWENYLQVKNSFTVLQQASEFADVFALRAYDSVHLSAAVLLFRQTKQDVSFACFDEQLNKAAKILGLTLF